MNIVIEIQRFYNNFFVELIDKMYLEPVYNRNYSGYYNAIAEEVCIIIHGLQKYILCNKCTCIYFSFARVNT